MRRLNSGIMALIVAAGIVLGFSAEASASSAPVPNIPGLNSDHICTTHPRYFSLTTHSTTAISGTITGQASDGSAQYTDPFSVQEIGQQNISFTEAVLDNTASILVIANGGQARGVVYLNCPIITTTTQPPTTAGATTTSSIATRITTNTLPPVTKPPVTTTTTTTTPTTQSLTTTPSQDTSVPGTSSSIGTSPPSTARIGSKPASASKSVGLRIGLLIAVLTLILVAAAIFLRRLRRRL